MSELLPTSEVARALGVSSESVRLWTRSGKLASVKTPLGRLVSRAEVERMQRARLGAMVPTAA